MRRAGGARAMFATPLIVAISAAAMALAACSPSPSPTPGPIATASIVAPASGSPAALPSSIPASPVTGVLTAIDASGLSDVSGFTLRLDDGRSFEFLIGTLDNGAQFPPGHLAEHLATSSPVRVYFRVDGTNLVAYRLEDAG